MQTIDTVELESGEKVHVKYNNRTYRIYVMLETADGNTDWPILYKDGRLATDYPEWFTREALDMARKVLSNLHKPYIA
jgi:hypothetical protein